MNTRTNQKFTLEDISQRKQEVLQDIRTQHKVIADTTQDIFGPILPSSQQGQSTLMKKINTGMIVFDGIMVGMKVFRSIRRIFHRK